MLLNKHGDRNIRVLIYNHPPSMSALLDGFVSTSVNLGEKGEMQQVCEQSVDPYLDLSDLGLGSTWYISWICSLLLKVIYD